MKELSALPLFAKVVELNSFAKAARQLNVPTTTVSRKIQQLEQDLGGKILNRSTRSLSLTELGTQVLPKAQLGAGICYLPYSLLRDNIQRGEMVTILNEWTPQDRTMLLVYPDKRHLPLKSQLFIKFIREKRDEFKLKLTRPQN